MKGDWKGEFVARFGAPVVRCRGVMLGGNVNNGIASGLFAVNANNAPSNSNWNYGASLS